LSVSAGRWNSSRNEGKKSEARFVDACRQKGYKVEKSSREVDINKHIDFFVYRNGRKTVGVDVKGHNHPECFWIEFKNVRGNKGWLYGEADWIAFELPELSGFVMVLRRELAKYCEANVDTNFGSKEQATRRYYRRANREDIIARFHLSDLQTINSYMVLPYKKID